LAGTAWKGDVNFRMTDLNNSFARNHLESEGPFGLLGRHWSRIDEEDEYPGGVLSMALDLKG
jgi:hypothetical protein